MLGIAAILLLKELNLNIIGTYFDKILVIQKWFGILSMNYCHVVYLQNQAKFLVLKLQMIQHQSFRDFWNVKHFSEIGVKLSLDQSKSTKPYNHYLKLAGFDFEILNIEKDTVFRLLTNMSETKAVGIDGLSNKLFKFAATVIAEIQNNGNSEYGNHILFEVSTRF